LALCTLLLATAMCLITGSGQADELTVPLALQVDLLDRVVRFERGYAGHADTSALVVVVVAKGDVAASVRAAAQAGAAIDEIGNLGARRAKVETQTFSSPAALRAAAREAVVLYLMPGFDGADLQGIAAAFANSNVLTVGASNGDAENGAALSFQLESSKPRVVVNLRQARAQGLDFNAQFLRLVKVLP
jgi:hypothetical protein